MCWGYTSLDFKFEVQLDIYDNTASPKYTAQQIINRSNLVVFTYVSNQTSEWERNGNLFF